MTAYARWLGAGCCLVALGGAVASCAPGTTPPGPLAERGIGGTGRFGPAGAAPATGHAPAGPAAILRDGANGIGGTGGPNGIGPGGGGPGGGGGLGGANGVGGTGGALQTAAQTGLLGIITGFGSVFVDDVEVGIAALDHVTVDGQDQPVAALRAGQFVVLAARGPDAGLQAVTLAVRHEVVGPVTRVSSGPPGPGRLVVAGQPVLLTPGVPRPDAPLAVGDWIAVSGLRRPDDVIVASRIDPASPAGPVLVHGRLVGGRIGGLVVVAPPDRRITAGEPLTVEGTLDAAGTLHARLSDPDLLETDPGALFAPSVAAVSVQTLPFGPGRPPTVHVLLRDAALRPDARLLPLSPASASRTPPPT